MSTKKQDIKSLKKDFRSLEKDFKNVIAKYEKYINKIEINLNKELYKAQEKIKELEQKRKEKHRELIKTKTQLEREKEKNKKILEENKKLATQIKAMNKATIRGSADYGADIGRRTKSGGSFDFNNKEKSDWIARDVVEGKIMAFSKARLARLKDSTAFKNTFYKVAAAKGLSKKEATERWNKTFAGIETNITDISGDDYFNIDI